MLKSKTDFVSYEALSNLPMTHLQMVSLTSDFPFGASDQGSPAHDANERFVGYAISSDFGYTVGKTILV